MWILETTALYNHSRVKNVVRLSQKFQLCIPNAIPMRVDADAVAIASVGSRKRNGKGRVIEM